MRSSIRLFLVPFTMACLLAGVAVAAPERADRTAAAHPGDLDASFGSGGMTVVARSADDVGWDLLVQPDGKILLGGDSGSGGLYDFTLLRFNQDGSLDETFGDGGVVVTQRQGDDVGTSLALQPDGKILLGGSSSTNGNYDFAVVRYTADGTLDDAFGSGGMAIVPSSPDDIGHRIALQSDGKIVVGGESSSGSDWDFTVLRLEADGSPDTGFGSNGRVSLRRAGDDYGRGLAVQPDGKIVLGGDSSVGGDFNPSAVRFNPDGTLDAAFGDGGFVVTPHDGDDVIHDLVLQPDGKIVLGGDSAIAAAYDLTIVRYTPDGTPDVNFGGDGIVTTERGSTDDIAYEIVLQKDGKIVLGGDSGSGGDYDLTLARYTPSGTLDTSFGDGGVAVTQKTGDDVGQGLAILPNGKFVMGGDRASNAGNYDFFVARFLGDTHQPDAMIKAGGAFHGSNVYNSSGKGQIQQSSARPGGSTTALIQIQNDGSASDAFAIRGPGAVKGFTVRYLKGAKGSTDVTKAVLNGTYKTKTLAPGKADLLRIVVGVKRTTKPGASASWLVRATSKADPLATDAVIEKVNVKR